MKFRHLIAAAAIGFLMLAPASAASFLVTIDTSNFQGTAGGFAFDLIGEELLTNSVTLSGFASDGGLGTVFSTHGNVSGAYPGPVKLDDATSFLNELDVHLIFGTKFSFIYTPTENPAPVQPTGFSLVMLGPDDLQLFATSDPTGSDVLLLLTIDGATKPDQLQVFHGLDDEAAVAVQPAPLPGALPLFSAGAALFGGILLRRKKKNAANM